MAFHEVRFPDDISRGASGGPERRTEIVMLGSGFEERNQRWADSRRRYDAGYGVKTADDLYTILDFFEERRGRFHGFRWRDWSDYRSGTPNAVITAADQAIGTGDGIEDTFQIVKAYGSAYSPWSRSIKKPVSGTVRIAVNGALQVEGSDYTINYATGVITFDAGSIPPNTHGVTAGFEFDVPARFDADQLAINLESWKHGAIPNIPIVEIRV